MDEIIETLVRAGYKRASASNLSDFDKIIGGMAWAMQLSSYDIDIDVFYADSLDLGQKIALTERLVMVLIALRCPYRLEPHQIVGLDHANLLPAFRWLLKRSEAVRQELAAFSKLLAQRRRQTDQQAPRESQAASELLASLGENFTARVDGGDKQVSFARLAAVLRAMSKRTAGSLLSEADAIGHLLAPADEQPPGAPETPEDQQLSSSLDDELHEREADHDDNDEMTRPGPPLADAAETTAATTCFTDDDAKTTVSGDDDDDRGSGEPPRAIELELSRAELEEHKRLDLELLATNQKILNLLKKLDPVPSPLEICQYQRRYVELHQQLIGKNKDVKKVFDLYNSLDVEKHYLERELSLLDSIGDNLHLTHNSAGNRDLLTRQLEAIIAKIQEIGQAMGTRVTTLRSKCAALNEEHVRLTLDGDDDDYDENEP